MINWGFFIIFVKKRKYGTNNFYRSTSNVNQYRYD